jgi:hypothetical protein
VDAFPLPADSTWRGGLAGFNIIGPINSAQVLQVRRGCICELPAGASAAACPSSGHSIKSSLLRVQSDIPSCKSYINIIDSVLLPFDPALVAGREADLMLGSLLGAGGCGIQGNAIILGNVLLHGTANLQVSYHRMIVWLDACEFKRGGERLQALSTRR